MNGLNPDPNDDFKGSSSPADLGVALFITFVKAWLLSACLVVLLGGGALYVLIHFLCKLW